MLKVVSVYRKDSMTPPQFYNALILPRHTLIYRRLFMHSESFTDFQYKQLHNTKIHNIYVSHKPLNIDNNVLHCGSTFLLATHLLRKSHQYLNYLSWAYFTSSPFAANSMLTIGKNVFKHSCSITSLFTSKGFKFLNKAAIVT